MESARGKWDFLDGMLIPARKGRKGRKGKMYSPFVPLHCASLIHVTVFFMLLFYSTFSSFHSCLFIFLPVVFTRVYSIVFIQRALAWWLRDRIG